MLEFWGNCSSESGELRRCEARNLRNWRLWGRWLKRIPRTIYVREIVPTCGGRRARYWVGRRRELCSRSERYRPVIIDGKLKESFLSVFLVRSWKMLPLQLTLQFLYSSDGLKHMFYALVKIIKAFITRMREGQLWGLAVSPCNMTQMPHAIISQLRGFQEKIKLQHGYNRLYFREKSRAKEFASGAISSSPSFEDCATRACAIDALQSALFGREEIFCLLCD